MNQDLLRSRRAVDHEPVLIGIRLSLLEPVAQAFLAAQVDVLSARLNQDYAVIPGLPAQLTWQMQVSQVRLAGMGAELRVCATLEVSAAVAAANAGLGAFVSAGVDGGAELCSFFQVGYGNDGSMQWQLSPGSLTLREFELEGTGLASFAGDVINDVAQLAEASIPQLAVGVSAVGPMFAWQGAQVAEGGPTLHPVGLFSDPDVLYVALATQPIVAESFVWDIPATDSPIVLHASQGAIESIASDWVNSMRSQSGQSNPSYVIEEIQILDGTLRTTLSVFDCHWPCTEVRVQADAQVNVMNGLLAFQISAIDLIWSSRSEWLVRGALPDHRNIGSVLNGQIVEWLGHHTIQYGDGQVLTLEPLAAVLRDGHFTLEADLRPHTANDIPSPPSRQVPP